MDNTTQTTIPPELIEKWKDDCSLDTYTEGEQKMYIEGCKRMYLASHTPLPADRIAAIQTVISSFAGFCSKGLRQGHFEYMTQEEVFAQWLDTPESKSLLSQLFPPVQEDWISVENQLPNNHTDVYFAISDHLRQTTREGMFYIKDSYDRSNVFISSDGGHFVVGEGFWFVTHWMKKEIPQLPQSLNKQQ